MKNVRKEPIRSEQRNTQVIRIKNIHVDLLKEVGKGNQQLGFEKIINVYRSIKRNPEALCMAHISDFMDDVKRFYGEDYCENMSNLPSVLRVGLRQGGNCDFSVVGNGKKKEKKDVEK